VERKRVVITGMGAICPVGNTAEEAWRNAAAGVTCIDFIKRFDTTHLEVKNGGEVKGFDPTTVLDRKEVRRTDRVTQLAVAGSAASRARRRA